jgi:hypothetical protein
MVSSEQKPKTPVSNVIFLCLLQEKNKIGVALTAVVLSSRPNQDNKSGERCSWR